MVAAVIVGLIASTLFAVVLGFNGLSLASSSAKPTPPPSTQAGWYRAQQLVNLALAGNLPALEAYMANWHPDSPLFTPLIKDLIQAVVDLSSTAKTLPPALVITIKTDEATLAAQMSTSSSAVSGSGILTNWAHAQLLVSDLTSSDLTALASGLKSWQPPYLFAALKAALVSADGNLSPPATSAVLASEASISEEIELMEHTYGPCGLLKLALAAGFPTSSLPTAIAVPLAESSGDPLATDHDSNGTVDIGIYQINWPTHLGVDGITHSSQLFLPANNASAALAVSNGGTDFQPWVTYWEGAYLAYLPTALATVSTWQASGTC